MAREITAADKLRLVQKLILELEAAVDAAPTPARRSWYGALADRGSAPSSEDIDQVRREMLRDLPRQDVA